VTANYQLFCILVLLDFFTIIPFAYSFQKIDPKYGVIIISTELTHNSADIIGANYYYVAGDVAGARRSAS
jgi:hypothetical protein